MEGMRGSEEEGTGVDKSAEDMQQIVLKALRINPMLTSHSACRLYPMLPDPPTSSSHIVHNHINPYHIFHREWEQVA